MIPLTFAYPIWFAALGLLPLLAVFYALGEKKSTRRLALLVAPKLRDNLLRGVHRGKRLFRFLLTLLALAALIVTLARPQWGFESQEITRKGRDIVVAVDTSRSMLADDVTPNRLARAKLAVQDLLRILEGDRIALVPFAGTAFLQAPLTIDYGAVQDSLDELDTTIIPKGGTNLAEAIQVSLTAFGKAEGAHKAIVLFTDGEELTADALKAANDAKTAGVRIFTVGVGSSEGAMIPIEENGSSTFVRDDSGQFVKTRLDDGRLKEIADLTGGFYVQLVNNSNAVQTLIDQGIRQLEMRDGTQLTSRRPIERYQWPLGLALVLFLLAQSLSDRRRSPLTAAILLFGVLGLHPAQAASQGLQLYEQGKYPEAMTAFQLEQKKSPHSPERNFNTGTAAYKAQRYNDALVAFGKASTSRDPQLRKRSEYNAANTLFQRGAANEDHGKKIADWKEALLHYDEALKIDPEYADAKTNREIVEKLIQEDEEKKQEQEKRDDEEKKDEQNQPDQNQQQQQQQQQQNQGKQEPQDQPSQDQNNDQQQQSSSGKSDPKQSPQPPQSGQNQSPDQKQANQDKKDQAAQPEPTPGEKKEGELKTANQGEDQKEQPKPEPGQQAQAAPAEERDGEMSQEQARALIEAMQGEEERVNLREQRNEAPVSKDW